MAIGILTGYGGGDARYFYLTLLLAGIGVAFLGMAGSLLVGLDTRNRLDHNDMLGCLMVVEIIFVSGLLIWLGLTNGFGSFGAMVKPNHLGLLYRDGAVASEPLTSGHHWKSPYVTFRQQEAEIRQATVTTRCVLANGRFLSARVTYSATIDSGHLGQLFESFNKGFDLAGYISETVTTHTIAIVSQASDEEVEIRPLIIQRAIEERTSKSAESHFARVHDVKIEFTPENR
jgi:hypothetical protein